MEKIQHDIAQLEKESKETNEWKTKMDALLMTFKKGFEGFEKVVEGINNNHTALNETIAMLTIKKNISQVLIPSKPKWLSIRLPQKPNLKPSKPKWLNIRLPQKPNLKPLERN